MMLTYTTGATCFSDLRTVEGILYPTYKEACKAMGMLEDDAEWEIALEEVTEYEPNKSNFSHFAAILSAN